MDFTHKFGTGPMPVSKLIEEYFRPAKVRRTGSQTGQMGKVYSNPPFSFKEQDFLNKFKYLYVIGREFEIPREDRQKTIGTSNVQTYKRQAEELINLQSWNDLIKFEKDHPGTLALVPGPCQICKKTHEGCGRPRNEPCHHMDLMRFSMEGIGIDTDALAKFELGLLLRWPDDGRLPQKLTALMGILSNEKIPMDEIKAYFPDAEKNFLNFREKENLDPNILSPEIKRQTSWLDNQKKQRRELEDKEGRRTEWRGFKSDSLDSGDYVKNQIWKTVDEDSDETVDIEKKQDEGATLPSEHLKNAPRPETELPTEHIGNQTKETGLPSEHIIVKCKDPVSDNGNGEPIKLRTVYVAENQERRSTFPKDEDTETVEKSDEEDDSKYKWLGFKRSVDEANENFYNRPIPKFSVTEEENESGEEQEGEPAEAGETPASDIPVELPSYKAVLPEDDEFSQSGSVPKWKSNPALQPEEDAAAETEETAPDSGQPADTDGADAVLSETPQSGYAPAQDSPVQNTRGSQTPAFDLEKFVRSMDVDTLKQIIAVKMSEEKAASAEKAAYARPETSAAAVEPPVQAAMQDQAESDRLSRREAQKAKLEIALRQKLDERERSRAEQARIAQEQAEQEAAAAREEQSRKEAREAAVKAEIEARLQEKEEEKKRQAQEEEKRRLAEEEAQRKKEEEARLAEEARRKEEEAKLPDASTIDNVLGAALSIAQAVSGSSPEADEKETAGAGPAAAPKAETQEPEKPTHKRHSYKWLNYKSELNDEEETLRDWKDNN